MKPVENQTLLNQLNWRFATKNFDPSRKIPAEDWSTLEQALILTPSSYGLQPWHFTVITSQSVKEKLVPASYGQHQLSQASHVVVFSVKKGMDEAYVDKYIKRASEVRGVPVEKLAGYRNMMTGSIAQQGTVGTDSWCARQVYIAIGFLVSSAAMLGIDACPMEGINATQYDQILGLHDKGYGSLAIVTLGYRPADDAAAKAPKVRFKAEDVVTHVE